MSKLMLDYEKINRFLFGGHFTADPVSGIPKYTGQHPILNEKNPRSGIHIAQHNLFSSGSLLVAAYARNQFDEWSKPNGVKLCVKLSAGLRFEDGTYAKATDNRNRISVELDDDQAGAFFSWLKGDIRHFPMEVKYPGQPIKELSFSTSENEERVVMFKEGDLWIKVIVPNKDCLSIGAVILHTYRVMYPNLSESTLTQFLSANYQARSGTNFIERGESRNVSGQLVPKSLLGNPMEDGYADPVQKKILWAIVNKKWSKQDLKVGYRIQQEASKPVVAKIIHECNEKNRFDTLDQIYEELCLE